MKYIIQALEFAIVTALIILSIITFNKINQAALFEKETFSEEKYHYAVITDDISSYAYERFIGGVDAAIKELDSVYEVYEVGDDSLEDVIEMVVITQVDGVILRLSNNAIASEEIDKCKAGGIDIITVGNDAPDSLRDVYIGTNKYNLGRHAATLAIKAVDGPKNIGVILGSEYIDEESIATNNFINGIQDIVTKNDNLNLSIIKYSNSIRAELLMDDILKEDSPINVLICTDPVDVNRIIRVLVDRNKVGDIKIVASGDTAEIKDGIEKRLITASIVEDYEEIGNMSVYFLNRVIQGEGVSTYVNVPFETLEQRNLGIE
ncbi:substrate-binding domain-containing protein [Fusibacter bizertensis]|uniref:Substrate-binding domain-containing protein n=1 Tax=Fusibacter bizertensis TaxID=1488331 RepID=A0ABT6NA26_9FIRM|nr:substrate-binding domain-containing protein [Fusibacter bizertensis]MDH8677264.1 substrate-binding domain-containing protein [Fusibacter bizertensis]